MCTVIRHRVGNAVVTWDESPILFCLAQSPSGAELEIVVDSVGGRETRQLVHHLRFGGTVVSYAVLSGQSASAPVLDLIGRHVNWTGFWLINWLCRTDTAVVDSVYRDLVEMVADGTLSAPGSPGNERWLCGATDRVVDTLHLRRTPRDPLSTGD